MTIHLYMLCYRYEALVASHLSPEAFGRYMATGTDKRTSGIVTFFEVDPELAKAAAGQALNLGNLAERCAPHPDGSPKRSKYVSAYRVLEHLPLSTLGRLYLTTLDGRTLPVDGIVYDPSQDDTVGANMYQELCPVPPLVVSRLGPAAFTQFMTDPSNPVSVPRIFFADLLLDRDETGHLAGYLPYRDPAHILDCIRSLEAGTGGKKTKTVRRVPEVNAFYRTVRRGFFVGDGTNVKLYPFPTKQRLEGELHQWWRSASAS